MKKNNLTKDDPSILPLVAGQELRRLAEEKLGKQKEASQPLTGAETQRLIHELRVHQIELEMQNEELVQARTETEALHRQFTDLYDLAPVGYFTLTRDGVIRQVLYGKE